jgi:ABC-2 type transport system permease protein
VAGAGFGDLARFYPGALLLSVLLTAVFAALPLIEERRAGFLLAVLASPAPRAAVVAGKVAGGATLALAQALLFAPALAFTGLRPGAGGLALTLALVTAAGAGLTAVGFWLAWHSRTPQGFHAIMNVVLIPLWMISGALFAREGAQGWMGVLMTANPLAYVLADLSAALSGRSPQGAGLLLSLAAALWFGARSVAALNRGGPRSFTP